MPYAEEIFHPGLATPVTAIGTLRGTADRMERDQTSPVAERSTIGRRFVEVRRGGETNLLPIPGAMAPMLSALRALFASDRRAALEESHRLTLRPDPGGWRVGLEPRAEATLEVALIGCGARIRALEIVEPGGLRRLIRFGGGS